MSYITEAKLSRYNVVDKQISRDNFIALSESRSEYGKPMVFLSHKHDEDTILQNVIAFLKNEGVDVYVDWMDKSMPAITNKDTAVRLKNSIKIANKFILVATQNAINSKWCNWELGLGDAEKYIDDIALLPIITYDKNFQGAEYLVIYPRIEHQDGTTKYVSGKYIPAGYYVIYPEVDGESPIKSLKDWLMG